MSRPTIFTAEATKAYWGGVMAFLAQAQVAMSAHSYDSITQLTQNDWITIAMGTLAAFGVVYGVTNADKEPEVFLPPQPVLVPVPVKPLEADGIN